MKIGLLTTYEFNYGSFFQAVSLQKKLQSMGHECELINEEIKKYKWFNLFLMYTINPILPSGIKRIVAKKIPQYNSYLKIKDDVCNLEISSPKKRNFSKLSREYDCIIVGSDELWSADRESIRYVPEYFGYGCGCPIFSYATCAIKLDVEDKKKVNKVYGGLKKFTSIAVRDDVSKEKIQSILPDKEIVKVLDPTLLNPYFAYPGPEKNNDRYILLYGQHYDEKQKKFIKAYAMNNNCSIRCVGWNQEWCDEFINTTSGEELQKVFAMAQFCFPSTFHGTIFSLLNHRQFVAMLNPLRGKKVELLLEELQLQDRIFTDNMHMDNLGEIDFQKVEGLLSVKRKQSEQYLQKALEGICK